MAEPIFEIDVEIKNANGLHMRPAMKFVEVASKFECDIKVSNSNTTADAKSIMQMTMLAALCGSVLKITAQGTDAKEAIATLHELIEQEIFWGDAEV